MTICGRCATKDAINGATVQARHSHSPDSISNLKNDQGQGGWFREQERHRDASIRGKLGLK